MIYLFSYHLFFTSFYNNNNLFYPFYNFHYEKVQFTLIRPQSAKQARNYWPNLTSNDENHHHEEGRHLGKHKKMQHVVSTSNDISRLLPKRIQHDK